MGLEEEIILMQGPPSELCNQRHAGFWTGEDIEKTTPGSAGTGTIKAGKCSSIET